MKVCAIVYTIYVYSYYIYVISELISELIAIAKAYESRCKYSYCIIIAS